MIRNLVSTLPVIVVWMKVSYLVASKSEGDLAQFQELKYYALILDECHHLRNNYSQLYSIPGKLTHQVVQTEV